MQRHFMQRSRRDIIPLDGPRSPEQASQALISDIPVETSQLQLRETYKTQGSNATNTVERYSRYPRP